MVSRMLRHITLQPAKSAAQQDEEQAREEEIIRELCLSNGINCNRIHEEGIATRYLEMFFSGYPRTVGLQYFPNLTTLCVISQTIKTIEGLDMVPKLKELWIAECQLEKISGLEELTHLSKLYLYSNQIKKIEHLDHLLELEILWLNNNQISIIEGLVNLKYIRELNLAENKIEKIGNSLNSLVRMEKLELSGNKISSFKDLTNLAKLVSLRQLGLKSPAYAPSPVGLLCNYSTHMIYHLPQIQSLDTYDITNKTLRELAETTVQKKKMYYNMKVKMMRRKLAEVQGRLGEARDTLLKAPKDRLRTLYFTIKEIDREVKELKNNDEDTETHESGTESDKDAREAKVLEGKNTLTLLKAKQKALKERLKKWDKKCLEMEFYHEETVDRLRHMSTSAIQRLLVELDSGGNIRFEDGKMSDAWFTSCHDLILSRFCAADYRDYDVVGIKINRITRVHNRMLRAMFDDIICNLPSEEETTSTNTGNTTTTNTSASTATVTTNPPASVKKLLEYLFWIWDPELPGGINEPARVLEEGFLDPDTYKKLCKDAAVPLTNALILADKPRMCYLTKQAKGKEFADSCPFRFGQMVIAKVYLGNSMQYVPNRPIEKTYFPKADSVFRPRQESNGVGKIGPTSSTSSTSDAGSQASSHSGCECLSRQCEWYVFNHELVMPEYVVDFEYLTKTKPKSPFTCYGENILDSKEKKLNITIEDLPTDEDVMNLEPVLKPRPRLIALSEELLIKATKATSLSNIKVLNLHGNGLNKLKHLQAMPHLRKLIISFNELTRLDDIAQMNLEHVDASFNKITSLEGLKAVNKLKYLDLSWNNLQNTRDDISILRKHAPVLATLDLRHNNWQKPEGLRLRAIGRIKTLTKLNGFPVTENEATAALRMAAGSRISQVSLLAHSRTDTVRPRTLSLAPFAHVLINTSRNKPDRAGEQDNLWYSQVTTLNLDGQHISKLSNLERLENLRWASFNDNDITKIEGLDNCINLEELSLEHNCITKMEGLQRLTKLRRLNLSHNYITSLDNSGLDRLVQLQFLSVESNQITTLAGLQRVTSLTELYAGNNRLENVREAFFLKVLPGLVILDLYGNPVVTSTDNYRLFIIYHLRSLKALDGVAIESSENSHARDIFGGRLTSDFVAERLAHANFNEIKELDFPQCSIRTVDLGNGDIFLNLRSVNLEHNNLTSFSGLIYLVNLRVLCLNHNHVECILPRPKQQMAQQSKGRGPSTQATITVAPSIDPYNPDSYTPLLESLEVLHLGYNGIKDMAALQLNRLTSLKALFLQGNEISKIEGLEGLQDLRELVLDRNKVKGIGDYSFVHQWNMQELHLEENRIRELSNLSHLECLQRLFLGMNRIQDLGELDKLENLPHLVELSVVGNAVARRLLHRPMLVYRMPNLLVIDGIPVSDEERTKAELYFMEQQPPQQITTTVEATLPGIGQYKTQIPVKVTNMQLLSGPFAPYMDKTFGGTLHISEDVLQQEVQRGGGRKRGGNRNEPLQGVAAPLGGSPKLSGTLSYQHASNHPNPNMMYSMGSRSQHQLSQVPYVPHHSQQGYDYSGYTDRTNKTNRR